MVYNKLPSPGSSDKSNDLEQDLTVAPPPPFPESDLPILESFCTCLSTLIHSSEQIEKSTHSNHINSMMVESMNEAMLFVRPDNEIEYATNSCEILFG